MVRSMEKQMVINKYLKVAFIQTLSLGISRDQTLKNDIKVLIIWPKYFICLP